MTTNIAAIIALTAATFIGYYAFYKLENPILKYPLGITSTLFLLLTIGTSTIIAYEQGHPPLAELLLTAQSIIQYILLAQVFAYIFYLVILSYKPLIKASDGKRWTG